MNCNFKDNVETPEMLKFGYARVGKDWQGEAICRSTGQQRKYLLFNCHQSKTLLRSLRVKEWMRR